MTKILGRFEDKDHEHQYLPLQQGGHKQTFEKIDGTDTYRLVNYLLLFCKCGTALMTEVEIRRQNAKEN